MKFFWQLAVFTIATLASIVCYAEGDLTRQEAIVIEIQVGANDGANWEPNMIELETGKLYQIVFKK